MTEMASLVPRSHVWLREEDLPLNLVFSVKVFPSVLGVVVAVFYTVQLWVIDRFDDHGERRT